MSRGESFDYVVVGAGSAGCALAARLAERRTASVLLLEAGRRDDSIWIHIPLGVGKLLTDARYAWKFETEPQAGLAGQRIYWPRGKVLGGTSALNGMVYVWGDAQEYDRWRELGNPGWGFEEVKPYFQRMERLLPARPGRGASGPMRITDRQTYDPDALSDAYIRACVQAGIPRTQDYNTGCMDGVRYLEQTAWRGRRWSTAVAYLRRNRSGARPEVRLRALATRVVFEGRRTAGVEYLAGGEKRLARAAREVILCAGSVQSPQLLELSGIGQGERLQRLGIPVVADVPGVGENLIDHLQVRCTYECTLPVTINDLVNSFWHRMGVGLKYLLTRKGMLAATSSMAHAVTRTRPERERPDVKVQIYHISGKDRYSRSQAAGIDPYSGFSIGGFLIHPESRGSIHARSPDPLEAPLIEPNYLAHEADRRGTVDLLKLVRRIAAQPALREVIVAERRPGPETTDDDGLLAYARETGQTSWHQIATCRMGNDPQSVVDARLRVRGVTGLRVADASIMPTMASTNTNAPAIMIGERAADLVLEDASAS